MKTISQIIDKQIAINPIVTDEEMEELNTPLTEEEIFDDTLLEEEVALIDELAKKFALRENKADFTKRVKLAIGELHRLNEQKCNNKDS